MGAYTQDDRFDSSRSEAGSLTLEATISVTIFSVLAATLSMLFPIYAGQNAMAHAILQSAESLALDAYAGEQMLAAQVTGANGAISGALEGYANWEYSKNGFASGGTWYRANDSTYYADGNDRDVVEAVQERLENYLVGEDGNVERFFLAHHIDATDMDDLDFEGTRVEDKMLYICVSYTFEDAFGIMSHLGLGPFEARQTACARLWVP